MVMGPLSGSIESCFFASVPCSMLAIEACYGARWWARDGVTRSETVWRFLVYGLRTVFLYGHLRALLRFSFTPVFSMPMGHKIIGLLLSLIVPVFWLYRE